MPLGYRSLMHFKIDSHGIFGFVDEQLRQWLVHKKLDATAVAEGTVELKPGVTGQLLDRTHDDGTRTARFTLIERKPAGAWTVRVTTHARAGANPWVLVDIITPETSSVETVPRLRQRVGVPSFVPKLLGTLDAYDGATRQPSTPVVIGSDGVGTVIDAVCDPDRRGLVLVAGTSDVFEMDSWLGFVKARVTDTVGVCTAFVLDPVATVELNRSLDGHGAPAGCFRTYLPDADPASASDARRHRIMAARTLAQRPSGYVRHVLAGAARAQVVGLPLPDDVAVVDRLMARWETEALLEVPTSPPVVAPGVDVGERLVIADEAEVVLALSDAVQAVVGDVPLDAKAVRILAAAATRAPQLELALERARDAINDLGDQVESARRHGQELQREMDDREIDNAIDTERMIQLDDQVRRLRKQLMELGAGAEAWEEVPESDRSRVPETMFELFQRLDELAYVRFTGDRDKALELDDLDPLGRAARKAWLALLALEDYARLRGAGEYTGTVYDYCRETPGDCHGWSAERHAPDESEGTKNNRKFAAARVFPVPADVEASGRLFMGAHFKLMRSGSISPRMHYYDDTGRSGLVYIGYLGRHLPNGQTN